MGVRRMSCVLTYLDISLVNIAVVVRISVESRGVDVIRGVGRSLVGLASRCYCRVDLFLFDLIGSCEVQVGWRVHTQSSVIEFRALYICHLIESDWFIFNANVYQGSFE